MTKQREKTDHSPWAWPIILGACGYVLASIFLIADGTKSLPDQIKYVFRNPAVTVWATLIALQVAAYAALVPALFAELREFPLPFRRVWRRMLGVGVVALVLFAIFILGHYRMQAIANMPVEQHRLKVFIITAVGFAIFLATLYGMCAVAIAADNLDEKRPTADRVSEFLELSKALEWYLLIGGLIVGGATLTTGTLQTAVSSLNPGVHSDALTTLLSPRTTLLYGLFGSAVIGLYYIPVYATLRSAGMRLCDEVLPMKQSTDDVISLYERRTKLEALLGLNKDWFDSLRTGLVLLAPLAGSATSLLIGKAQ